MFLDNKEEFQTVWQLSHNWVGADPDTTDTNAVSPKLKDTIHLLMLAIAKNRIMARTRRWIILEDDSIFTSPLDSYHRIRFFLCLKRNKFNKSYLDNLYVERNEVINWCANDPRRDPPPCWAPIKLSSAEGVSTEAEETDDNNGWYDKLTELRRKKVICIGLAEQIWLKYPGLTYKEMYEHEIMKEYGYSSRFNFNNFKTLVRPVASEPAKLPGSPLKSEE